MAEAEELSQIVELPSIGMSYDSFESCGEEMNFFETVDSVAWDFGHPWLHGGGGGGVEATEVENIISASFEGLL